MRLTKILHIFLLACGLLVHEAHGADTSILFVGEDVSTLTIASRRAESVDRAPAIASVITSSDIKKHGYMTLAEVLSRQPGFFISPRNFGSIPYLRGLPSSVLFLYDSVHLTSDAAKTVQPVDEELALAAVERIEIIRGPGSVLWGPDAYSGIVNIVPKRGRDVDGVELNAYGGSARKEAAASLNWGHNAGLWEAFVSLNARSFRAYENEYNIVRFAGPGGIPVPPSRRMGSGSVERSTFAEAVFNFSWQDWLRLSGRWSEANRKYILEDPPSGLRWPASSLKPMWYLKLELEKTFQDSDLRLNAWYNEMDDVEREIDLEKREHKSHVAYGELLYDREFWGGGAVLTLGVSGRYNWINGAEIAKGYPPDFFDPDNIFFLPRSRQSSFDTTLVSGFAQFKRHWPHVDAWFGLRIDDHSEYDLRFSPSAGVVWSPSRKWNFKLVYGTAYRTPYASQFTGRDDLEPEEVQNFSLGITWRPGDVLDLSLTGFWNQIRHETGKDPYYGGLSDTAMQDLYGVELGGDWRLSRVFRLRANATFIAHDGDDETYQYSVYVFEDGEWVKKPWISWSVPFETGPRSMVNASLEWNPLDRLMLAVDLKYEKSWRYSYDKGAQRGRVPGHVQVDMALSAKDTFFKGLDLQVTLKNLFSTSYDARGTYGPADSPPFNAYAGFTWHY